MTNHQPITPIFGWMLVVSLEIEGVRLGMIFSYYINILVQQGKQKAQ